MFLVVMEPWSHGSTYVFERERNGTAVDVIGPLPLDGSGASLGRAIVSAAVRPPYLLDPETRRLLPIMSVRQ
jgi:hypothetical protein